MKNKNIIIIIIVAILAGAGAYYFGYKTGYDKGFDAGKEFGIAASKTEVGTTVTSPLEKLPETNPFEKAVNPFKDLYKNPFK